VKPTYNPELTYDENYQRGPEFKGEVPDLAALNEGLPPIKFLGHSLNSGLGIPAGPLLNSAYVKLYADLGFDVLTYKTVRTQAQPCHPFPNVRAVQTRPDWYITNGDNKPTLYTRSDDKGELSELSITNSFGMPSQLPEVWREDVALAKAGLWAGQMLVVSVVGTARADGGLEELAADYALAAIWAKEAGADAIEANLSCPNVCTGEGSLYQSPEAVQLISQALKARLGQTPFLLKLGFLSDEELTREVVRAAYRGGAAGLAAINTIPARVLDRQERQALPGEGRLISGICGSGIRQAGLEMLARLRRARSTLGLTCQELELIGVGGVMTAEDGLEYFRQGADGVQSGTGAMWQPYLARDFKEIVKHYQPNFMAGFERERPKQARGMAHYRLLKIKP